ncbi:transcription factor bHLH140 isoform X2 [Phalaenopsis equestris]|uniref:transcription factor bHLH140 isoform X2 n=1 Tax=Phalaenopsis equestris TaxID=78828 RepID=UPI0009E29C68|nr:transcription factor bHLH140 isoform X2 [Phalaenopsis equestris]
MAVGPDSSSSLLSEQKEGKPLIVILVGAPGSGKSTFCNDVISGARRTWTRICQDTIANGKAGTKAQCLQSAINALQEGKNVLIDRCNLELEQRSEFLKLGGTRANVHSVVLDLPARVCISRSVKRTGHEGNLQGGKAAAVVNRMLQKKVLPKLNEGFSRITFCQNDEDVKTAVNTYRLLGLFDNLSSGVFGQKSEDSKVQQGIMKFLKKVDTDEFGSENSSSKDKYKENNSCSMVIEKGNEAGEDEQNNDLQWNDAPTLAFPSISTSDFQFNMDKASDVIVEAVADFLSKVEKVELILVDLSPKSKIISLVKFKASKKNVDTNRFSTYVGDITRLYSRGGLICNVIANASNWRLKPGGGGVNAAIFNAGGEALEIATKEQADTISPGGSVIVPLPRTSPLYQREGVTHVIHVLGPNMNPQRPNCLKDDYEKGCKVLYEAYTSLFNKFASIALRQNYQKEYCGDSKCEPSSSFGNFFGSVVERQPSLSEPMSKREVSHDYDSNKKSKANGGDFGSLSQGFVVLEKEKQNSEGTDRSAKISWGSWAHALHQIAMHPEKHSRDVIEISDDFVVINDLYPKATKHILVTSRLPGLDCLADIRREHLPMLQKMHAAGLKWAEKFSSDDPSLVFRLGYHSVPSMRQLHLHVISQDFDSTHLKKKKHWNSFNTPFFRDSIDVHEEININGLATLKDEKILSSELRCHRCKSAHPNIPRLRSHIAACKTPFASHLQNGRLVFAASGSPEPASDI